MCKIIASGFYCGNRITVEAIIEDGILKILVDDMEFFDIQQRFYELIKVQPAMGGTYFPDENSLLAAYNVLQNTFFDSLDKINILGDIGTIPFKNNVVY